MRFFLLSFLLLVFCGCSSKPEVSHFSGVAMTIPYRVTVGGPLTKKQHKEITALIASTFQKTDQIFNNWNPASEISRLNAAQARVKIVLSPELKSLLELAGKVHESSGGRFDPSVAPLSKAWKAALREGHLPESVHYPIGLSKFHIEGNLCWKEETECACDLGGIAKGHAVDLLTETLKAHDYTRLYVEWGGEIRTVGLHPEGRPWMIGIKGVTTIPLSDLAVATSGNYEQLWNIDGVLYTHIVDPRTQRPLLAQPGCIASATVIAPTCAYADAVATALMLFETPEEALAWTATLPDVMCYLAQ